MQISGTSIINYYSTCTLLLFETRNRRLSDTHYVQRNTSTLIEGNDISLTVGSKLLNFNFISPYRLPRFITTIGVKFIKRVSAANLEDCMSFNKSETRACTRVFHRKHSNDITFHCTHYLVSMFYFHSFKFKAHKFRLRSSLKVSADC